MESDALLVVIYCFVPLRINQRHLFPAIEDRRAYLAVHAVVVEEEGLLGLDLSFEFLEVREEALADEFPVVDHLGVALACARTGGGFGRDRDDGRRAARMLAGTSNRKSNESSTTSSPRPSGSTLIRRSIKVSTKSSFG